MRETPCPSRGKSSTPLLGEMLAKSLLTRTWGCPGASVSRAMSVPLTCLCTPISPVRGKGGIPSPVHRMSISISLEIPDLVTLGGKYCFRKSTADLSGRMSDSGCATDPVGTAAGQGQDVHGCYERLTRSQSNGKTIVIRQVALSNCCPVAKQLIWGGVSRRVLEGSCSAIPVFCSPEHASWLVLVLNMVVVPVSTSRPLHLMRWRIWSFPLVALVDSQRQSPIPPVCAEPTATVLATGIWYFVCSTNLMLRKTCQSMSYSCCGWCCSVPASSSSHQQPARKLNS